MVFQFWAANSATRSPPSAASFVTRKPFSAVAAAPCAAAWPACRAALKDNQTRPVLYDCFLYALVGQGKLPFCFINHKHPVKVCGGFYQAGLDGIAQTVLGGLINHLKRLYGLHARKRPASTTGNGKAQRKGGLSLAGVALYYGYFPKGDIRFP